MEAEIHTPTAAIERNGSGARCVQVRLFRLRRIIENANAEMIPGGKSVEFFMNPETIEMVIRLPKQSCEHCDFYDLGQLPEIVRAQYFRDRLIDQWPMINGVEWPVNASDFEFWRNQIIR